MKNILFFLLFALISVFHVSCSKDDDSENIDEPSVELKVTTFEAIEIFENSAKLQGEVVDYADLEVISAYFEYWLTEDDETPVEVNAELTGSTFSKVVSDLLPGTEYEYKTIVEFSNGKTVEGDVQNFTTLAGESEPVSINLFVSTDVEGGGNGKTWNDAYNDINAAVNAASIILSEEDDVERVELWVMKGIYDFSANSLTLQNNIEILGGFSGTETSLEERDYENNVSILDGGGVNRVIVNEYSKDNVLDNSAKLDGFTIQNGRGEGVEGGAMYNLFAAPVIRNCIFKNNSTTGRGGAVVSYVNLEEGETLEMDPLQFINCYFTANSASGDGGALYSNHRTHLNGGEFENNSSPWGGAAYFSKTEVYAVDVKFNNNHGHNRGGAIYSQGMVNLQLTDCTFTENYTTNTGSEFGGGAIFFDNGHNEVINCLFEDNATVGDGGALYPSWNFCELLITGSEIRNNEAINGGGILASVISKLMIDEETLISANKANDNGGGLYIHSNETTETDFEFLTLSQNEATSQGGGMYLLDESYSFLNVAIQSNSAAEGDGLYLNNASIEDISGNCFTNNSCSSEGTGNCPDFSNCD